MKKISINLYIPFLYFIFISNVVLSQSISGTVFDNSDKFKKNPLPGASISWLGTSFGTSADKDGHFKISQKGIKNMRLVVSFLGYITDTVQVTNDTKKFEIFLNPDNKNLNAVEINEKLDNTFISKANPRKVQVLTTGELYRAACCNLSESFETNASVDVSYSDAISGAKQIQLLGLSGVYSQIQAENVPTIRGLASSFGLNYIPGSWMESIQISKGTSSVINGYESITGQINVEYKKPSKSEKLFVNLYTNNNERYETNLNTAYKFNDKISTMLMLHTDNFNNKFDRNKDSFLDLPKSNQFNIFNRWDYINTGKFVSRFGIKYLEETRDGGTMNYNKNSFKNDTAKINAGIQPYGFEVNTKRTEFFWKNGILFPDRPYQSIGLIISGVNHEQSSFYGINNYFGNQKSIYSNLLFQSIIGNTNHKYTLGVSYSLDDYKENYDQTIFTYHYQVNNNTTEHCLFTIWDFKKAYYNWDKREEVPGAFAEYTYTYLDVLTLIGGLRIDHHNTFGSFITPRLHVRYHIDESTVLRASAGKGYRTANVIAENFSILASQRNLIFSEKLNQEEAWNYGVNLTKDFKVLNRKCNFDLDIYRTDFENQVIVDMDSIPTDVFFYNLKGKSYSNSYQAQLTIEPIKRFSILFAFRINDVKTTINNKLLEKPFVNKYKGLITLSYATKFDFWKFDFTTQFNGSARLTEQQKMPTSLKRPERSPEYIILNAQISRQFKYIDIYIGGENLTDYRQKDPITEPDRPYHTHFDSSMVWGPIIGTVIYTGLRLNIK